MGHGKKPIAQTYYEVTGVKHTTVNKGLDYSSQSISWYLNPKHNHRGKELISLIDFEKRLNSYKNKVVTDYIGQSGILKGLYGNYYGGKDCVKNVPYLCFDIDVKDTEKKRENLHLFCHDTNQIIFDELKKLSVICWRSNSGNGIAGVLYVPQLAEYLESDKVLHLDAGEAITTALSEYLHKITGIDYVEFDQAQSKFRQIRYVAEQKTPRELNNKPLQFSYKVEEKKVEITKGVPAYKNNNYKGRYGKIHDQFDSDNDILTVALYLGFSVIGSENGNKVRVLHTSTTSDTSGEINRNENAFFNHSSSFGRSGGYSPSQLVCKLQFGGDWGKFYRHLNELGYKEIRPSDTVVKKASKALKEELENTLDEKEAGKIIYSYSQELNNLAPNKKKEFIADNCIRPELEKHFKAYFDVTDYKIKYDHNLVIQSYVTEQMAPALDYADKHTKVVLKSETGFGKTTAIFDIHKHRPNARILVLVPLTVILDQLRSDHPDKAIYLDGTSSPQEKDQAKFENFVFATYDQGPRILLEDVHGFDYIVIDEVHQLITASSWRDVVSQVTPLLENSTIIGLTGTANGIFKQLGYKLLNVDVATPERTKIEVRYSNINNYEIALSHITNADAGSKILMRINDKKGIRGLKEQLVKLGFYKDYEILVLYSEKHVKQGKDFKQLSSNGSFADSVKVVLTTSLIDEGLSIRQAGFTDIVFLTDWNTKPEAIKQFYARFRNVDHNRKNYLYQKTRKKQDVSNYNPVKAYDSIYYDLKYEAEENVYTDVITSYSGPLSNDKFYYSNNTINTYFLALAVTTNQFQYFNADQFLDYLEINYNLEIKILHLIAVLRVTKRSIGMK